MKIFIKINLEKVDAVVYADKAIDILTQNNNSCFMDIRDQRAYSNPKISYAKMSDILKEIDLIVVLGGDGTVLECVRYALKSDKAILGINIGRVGFLCQLEKEELYKLSSIGNAPYEYTERMLVEARHISNEKEKTYVALNDFVFSKGVFSRMIEIDIKCLGSMIETYRADGVIFATPSGSTAYAMSAGGPIISPNVDAVLFTPICPYSRFQTPICFGSQEEIEVRSQDDDIKMVIDGVLSVKISDEDKVIIKAHDKRVKFLKIDNCNFYDHLWKKMRKRG